MNSKSQSTTREKEGKEKKRKRRDEMKKELPHLDPVRQLL
jgi:hypothetical protein